MIRLATHIKNPVPMMLMMIPIVKRMANTLFEVCTDKTKT
jgi:hypothetical protein